MAQRAFYTGKDAIMQAFEVQMSDTPYYSIWLGKTIIKSYNGEDVEKGTAILEDLLQGLEDADNTDLIILKFHPEKSKSFITDKTPVMATLPVRVCGFEGNNNVGSVSAGDQSRIPYRAYQSMESKLISELKEPILNLDARLKALEESEIEPEQPTDMLGRIAGLLENPVVMALVEKLLPVALSAFGSIGQLPGQQQYTPPMQVAGLPGEPEPVKEVTDQDLEILNNSIHRLSQHCDVVTDLKLLADLAETKPDIFKMMLLQLKSM